MARFLMLLLGVCGFAAAQSAFFPLSEVKPGMRGAGKTVFRGDQVEDFQVEILGVLDNIGPKQSLILARISGGPLGQTGVMQGMSGSPIYIDGKLAGALAMAFPFSKEPIAAIRPIEEMVRAAASPAPAPLRAAAAASLHEVDLTRSLPKPFEALAGGSRLVEIATPVSFSGFTEAAIRQFAPQLRALGLEPHQGVSAGGRLDPARLGDPASLKPGSMISVQLMTGDMSMGADGTVTHIQGGTVYGFGHRFLSVGATSLPFARAEVLALLPTLSTSFKISTPRELLGVISQDRNTGISGRLGERAALVPVSISVSRGGRRLDSYRVQMVNDRFLSPVLVQIAVFSAIDSTERTVGAASFLVKGRIEFDGEAQPIRLDNMFAADNGSALQVSLSAAIPLAYVLQSGFERLQVRNVALEIESLDQKKQLQIDQVSSTRREARPGETVGLIITLAGDNGLELVRKLDYRIPDSARPGPLLFTIADGASTNLTEFRHLASGYAPRSASQLISTVNGLRPNTRAYVRVWRPDPAFQLEGEDFSGPPPSVALILGRALPHTPNAKLAELEIHAGEFVISGMKTLQVEIKE